MTLLIRKLGISCDPRCKFHPDKIGWDCAERLAAVRAKGAGAVVWARAATEILGRPVNLDGGISRHFKHYMEPVDVVEAAVPDGPKPTDIAILDSIIGAGFRNSKNWKPTIRDTLEAMKLKASMTGNSAFDDLIALFDVDDEDDGVDEVGPELSSAIFSIDERPDDSSEDLEEPLGGE